METREDEEQSIKLTEILELLVAAGYFRARIKGLSPFDKVSDTHTRARAGLTRPPTGALSVLECCESLGVTLGPPQVVGGMTWCITTCNFDIDVDLLFQENSTIGQKM